MRQRRPVSGRCHTLVACVDEGDATESIAFLPRSRDAVTVKQEAYGGTEGPAGLWAKGAVFAVRLPGSHLISAR